MNPHVWWLFWSHQKGGHIAALMACLGNHATSSSQLGPHGHGQKSTVLQANQSSWFHQLGFLQLWPFISYKYL